MKSFIENQRVWVDDSTKKETKWTDATVLDDKGDSTVLVKDDNTAHRRVARNLVLPRNPSNLRSHPDLIRLSHMHKPAVLQNLYERYSESKIYTLCGSILIALNPYEAQRELYNESQMKLVHQREDKENAIPHVYHIAESAYRALVRDWRSQSILVSGESGAGKTETSRHLLAYLSFASSSKNTLNDKIVATTPILEAFGNAKTRYNDNSSRFGKFVMIQFNRGGAIEAANIRTYLLEKSRVCKVRQGERNFHIFYQLVRGLRDKVERSELHLLHSCLDYRYLSASACYDIPMVDDTKTLETTLNSMKTLGFSKDEISMIFRVLSCVLLLGNLEFSAPQNDKDPCNIKDEKVLNNIAHLMGIDSLDHLRMILLFKKITAGGSSNSGSRRESVMNLPLSKDKAEQGRDSLAMYLYDKLLDWIVRRCNDFMSSSSSSDTTTRFIGILDIYGFESFDENGFEQFCINYANEKLQQLFNHHVFVLEQEEYKREGLQFSNVEFRDNRVCIELIEGGGSTAGIIRLLDDLCRAPKPSDESIVTTMFSSSSALDKSVLKRVDRDPKFGFEVRHYAQSVQYSAQNFLDKNMDFLVPEREALLHSSRHFAFLSNTNFSTPRPTTPTLAVARARSGSQRNSTFQFSSVAAQFKESLGQLVSTVNETSLHYIRCIKPNTQKTPKAFEPEFVTAQLAASGVFEAVRISMAGFPTRLSYEEFTQRYSLSKSKGLPSKETTLKILVQYTMQEKLHFLCGNNKLFFAPGALAALEQQRINLRNKSALRIQTAWKRHLLKRRLLRRKAKALIISLYAAKVARQRVHKERLRVRCIQLHAAIRGYLLRKKHPVDALAKMAKQRLEPPPPQQPAKSNRSMSVAAPSVSWQEVFSAPPDPEIKLLREENERLRKELQSQAKAVAQLEDNVAQKLAELNKHIADGKHGPESASKMRAFVDKFLGDPKGAEQSVLANAKTKMLKELSQQNTDLREELARVRANENTIKQRLVADKEVAMKEVDQVRQELHRISAQREAETPRYQALQSEANALTLQRDDLNKRLKKMQELLDASTQTERTTAKKLEEVLNRLTESQSTNEQLQLKIIELERSSGCTAQREQELLAQLNAYKEESQKADEEAEAHQRDLEKRMLLAESERDKSLLERDKIHAIQLAAQKELEQKATRLSQLINANAELVAKEIATQEQLLSLEKNLYDLQEQLDISNTEKAVRESELSACKLQTADSIQEQQKNHKTEIEHYTNRLKERDRKIQSLSSELAAAQHAHLLVAETLAATQRERDALVQQNETLSHKLGKKDAKNTELKERLEQTNRFADEHRVRVEILEREVEAHKQERQHKIETFKRRLEEADATQTTLKASIAGHIATNKQTQEDLQREKAEAAEMARVIRLTTKRLHELAQTLDENLYNCKRAAGEYAQTRSSLSISALNTHLLSEGDDVDEDDESGSSSTSSDSSLPQSAGSSVSTYRYSSALDAMESIAEQLMQTGQRTTQVELYLNNMKRSIETVTFSKTNQTMKLTDENRALQEQLSATRKELKRANDERIQVVTALQTMMAKCESLMQ